MMSAGEDGSLGSFTEGSTAFGVIKFVFFVGVGWLIAVLVVKTLRRKAPPSTQDMETPCGRIRVFNPAEALFLSYETFNSESHFRRGISIEREKPLILDIGANVGFFTRYVKWKWPQAIVHAVEPIPESAELLRHNVAHLSDVHVYQYGLSDCREKTQAQFNVNLGFASGATSAQGIVDSATKSGSSSQNNNDSEIGVREWLSAFNRDFRKAFNKKGEEPSCFRDIRNWCYSLYHTLPFMIQGAHKVTCEMVSLQWLLDNEIRATSRAIDLLKVDVEGSELQVLRGIDDATFSLIENVVVEVHDEDDSLAKIQAILRNHKFQVSVDREDWEFHRFANLYLVYGSKPKGSSM
eukprot:gb/GECG01015044.1/.p1 GENE.gb/GECG01015044.1/~~gb/GECG01015044.1/.p1  ORF type:complete len:351 (+),score=43.31 gb/GECG01015044.1/:1-1053(+)